MLVFTFLYSAFGQTPKAPTVQTKDAKVAVPADAAPTGLDKMTVADVEAFLDGLVPMQLARDDIAGVTIIVVKDGKKLFAKGYGFSDVEKKKPVVPEKTLFRPGSISKLFTWTAIMQLFEQGKLDLDTDVNKYLDFEIPEAFGKPITLKNILTHTPGFEEQIKDLFTFGKKDPNLGEYVKTHIPRRIFPPGTTPAYSNYGTALAGYIIERVSGQSFHEYIEKHIFKPLGMNSSSFRQPLSPKLAPSMSRGYLLGSDKAKEFEVVNPYPAGSLSSTATDMAKFMIAHLSNGQFGDTQILKPETAKLMHSRLFALDKAANAMAYGFYEESRNGHRIIGHGGDTVQFHSDLHLIPDAGIGFFVSYNSGGRGQVSGRTLLWHAFLDRYFPLKASKVSTLESAAKDAAAVSGSYLVSRRSEGSFFKAFSLIGEAKVYANEDGTISVNAFLDPNGKPKRFSEVSPMVFRDVNGQDTLIFKPDQNGTMQLIISYPFMVFKRVGLWQNSSIMLPVFGISLSVMLLTLILWFVSWWVRKHYGRKLELTRMQWWLRIAVRSVFALDLVFIAVFTGLMVHAISNLDFFSDSGNRWFLLAQAIGLLGTIGTLVVIFNAIYAWMTKRFSIWMKLQATIFVIACFGFLWLVFAGNLLSFTTRF